MNSLLKRSFFLSIVSVVLLFASCNKKSESAAISEFAPYITAYTGGLVYTNSAIWIELVNDQAGAELNTELKEQLFSFTPAVNGKTYWETPRRIKFVPDEGALKSGQLYQAAFKLGKVVEVPKRLSGFNFTFQVEERNFTMQVHPLIVNKDNPDLVSVRGELQFSDVITFAAVQKMLSATLSDGTQVSPSVSSYTDKAKVFSFSIDDIQKRDNEALVLTITADGKAIGAKKAEKQEVIIPAADAFTVLNTEIITSPEFGVQITFSDPISATQNLAGLITLGEVKNYTRQVKENKVNLFFERGKLKNITINVNEGLKNSQGKKIDEAYSQTLVVERLKPAVQVKNQGNILPDSKNLILPFRAVNLRAVDMNIIQVYENNVLMFLQSNTLGGTQEIRRAGRLVYKKTLRLDADPSKDLSQWNDYYIDLANIIKHQPGAIYHIELSFTQNYSAYQCDGDTDIAQGDTDDNLVKINSEEITEEEQAYWDNPDAYFYYYGGPKTDWSVYRWQERDNPCHPSYYMSSDRVASCNVLATNIGVVAKANSENKLWVSVADILTTKPVANARITIYNLQLQPIGSATTDAEGFAVVSTSGVPFALVAEAGGQKTYLRLVAGEDNSTSRFDTGGKKIEKGLKGYIYGERGVWRPGDTLHLTFVLHDPDKKIPANHPVSFEAYNPRGQFYNKQVATQGVNGFYTFTLPTSPDDPTGLWNAYVKVGGASFHKSLRVEAIKPNRLKINLELPSDRIDASEGTVSAVLTSAWLTGATARNLDAKVEMKLTKTNTQFKGYSNYTFSNPATDFYTSDSEIFDGQLNADGVARFSFKVPKAEDAPGMLNATITARVFEPGGDASIYTQSVRFSPFSSYVGLNVNQPKDRYIETDTDHVFDVVTLNADGKPVNRDNLEYKIYKIGWSWWWQQENESFANYVNNSSYTPVAGGRLKTVNGKASFTFNLRYPDWGRYLVYVKDKNSGHAAGSTVTIDWPDWRGRSDKADPSGVKMLSFSTDKSTYNVGEDVTVIIPASAGGTALVALENGSSVLSRTWVQVAEKQDTKYTFRVTPEMSPNFYIHISLLQPHAQTVNDLPIRMYGVVPVMVSHQDSRLEPQIGMPDVLRPEEEFTVKVSERSGRAMTYTLAVVDDGLLDLTNFKTPNAWDEFYSREALGIRTWDMYDYVIGAFAGRYGSLFGVGGDEELKPAETRANRFKPVVRFIGPFTLDKGGENSHTIKLPVYVGSVRTMVVAGQDGAFGNAQKTTPVRSPLMILSTLPRVVSTNEEIQLPVNVFVMEDGVKNVSVKVETTGLLQLTDGATQSLSFSATGDEMVYFGLKTGTRTGVEKVTVTATGGGKTSRETIEIDVRNPNPAVIVADNKLLNAGETANFAYHLSGNNADDDWVKLEVSRIPSVDISRRFDFLYDYQHYCTEQLTSRALPLLYVDRFKEVNSTEGQTIRKNVLEAIQNLYGRQLANGGFVYWTGQTSVNEWVTSYAGHFLVAAKEKGYNVNNGVIERWKSYQRRTAQNWTASSSTSNYYSYDSELQQAYRLYTLALAGSPELGAMNLMKEKKDLSLQARWRLAAAYAIAGKVNVAEELVFNAPTKIKSYTGGYTYGSSIRDGAMILETLVLMGHMEEAFEQARVVSQSLSNETYFSTQSTAYALVAMGTLAGKTSGEINFDWTLNGKKQETVKSPKAVYQADLPTKPAEGKIAFTNRGEGLIYVNLVSKSKPVNDTLPVIANHLRVEVTYTDLNGDAIKVSELEQSTDFVAVVKVSNLSTSKNYTDLALTHIIPSGWEIFNERMTGSDEAHGAASDSFTYQDIRDDRVLTYFDLRKVESKVFRIRLQASYVGSYVLPAVQCEAMYDTTVQARTKAARVKVVK
ncbi:alpha-2-macroglobulin [Paludibacter sp. 221]|uniref:alpha-2-macroglobulin family protein n=1 Tax=Paludibacter sp. 221 TaxID=2302939 RepID=UPI0013D628D3|nr:MG2 domain-containing protein [Paludibacter sp. 221]NDV47524.1 alpha-2-macroglobulin [Paludibacter sp. 221]